MTAIALKGHRSGTQNIPASPNATITIPGPTAAGDTVIVAMTTDVNGDAATFPTGWTIDYDAPVGTGQRILAHRTLVAGDSWIGTTPGTIAITWPINGEIWSEAVLVLDGTVYSGVGTIGTFTTRVTSQTSTAVPSSDTTHSPLVFFHEKSTSQTSQTVTGATVLVTQMPVTGYAGSIVVATYDIATAGTVTVTALSSNAANSNGGGVQYTMTPVATVVPPTAAFTDTTALLVASFTDGSTAHTPYTVASWAWTFGDGGTSTSQNPTHTYASAGTYTVALTVTDSNGTASSPVSHTVTVTAHVAPAASFSDVATSTSVAFTDTSTFYDSATLSSQTWDFGDNSGAVTTSNPTHRYMRAGTYTVTHSVTDSLGATGSTSSSITVVGITADYWDGTAWHALKLTEWNGTTEVIPTRMDIALNVGQTWTQMKANGLTLYGAHRGGSLDYVEMTAHAYRAAAMLWPDHFLEISVQADADGVWWCQHDAYFDRMVLQVPAGTTLPVASAHAATIATYQQSPYQTNTPAATLEPVAKLTDVLAQFGGKRVIFIERKGGGTPGQILDLMDANGGPDWFVWKQDWNNGLQASGDARVSTSGSNIPGGKYDTWGYFFAGADMTTFNTYQASATFVGLDYNLSDADLATSVATAGASRIIGHILPTAAAASRMLATGMRGLMVSGLREVNPRS